MMILIVDRVLCYWNYNLLEFFYKILKFVYFYFSSFVWNNKSMFVNFYC